LIYHEKAANSVIDYNLYYDSTLTNKFNWNESKYSTFGDWKTNSSLDANSPDVADSLFTNPGSDDFTLQPNSPVINAGIIPVDFENVFQLDPNRTKTTPWRPFEMKNDYDKREIGAFGSIKILKAPTNLVVTTD